MSTTFQFTIPRQIALTTGLKLIAWAKRPATETKRRAVPRPRPAREELAKRQRELDVDRYLSQVRQIL